MAENSQEPIVLRVDAVEQIFNAPDVNPFAVGAGNILGEAALDRLLLQQQVQPRREIWPVCPWWWPCRLTRSRPTWSRNWPRPSNATAPPASRTTCFTFATRRLQHSVGLAIVFGVVVAVLLLALLLATTVLAGISALAQGMIAGALCVFSWVILWDPLEALLFEWVEPTCETASSPRSRRCASPCSRRSEEGAHVSANGVGRGRPNPDPCAQSPQRIVLRAGDQPLLQ